MFGRALGGTFKERQLERGLEERAKHTFRGLSVCPSLLLKGCQNSRQGPRNLYIGNRQSILSKSQRDCSCSYGGGRSDKRTG